MVILGIDYGTRWIGLALGDTETKFAFPYKTLEREKFTLPYIENTCKSETVGQIIIGLPKLWQNPTPLQKEIEAFGTMLRARLQMPVEFTEEIFTSELAKTLSPVRARHSTHAQAATLIVENYFISSKSQIAERKSSDL